MIGCNLLLQLMEECLSQGISPVVTLSHFDMPYGLENEHGGWLNPKSVDWFVSYADVCFQMFGHLVPIWATFNEPEQTVWGGWEVGVWPPGKSENMGRDIYTASNNSFCYTNVTIKCKNWLQRDGKNLFLRILMLIFD